MIEKNSINEALEETVDIRCMIQICENMEFWLRDFQENVTNEESAIIENTIEILTDFLWNSDCQVAEINEHCQDVLDFLFLVKKYTKNQENRSILKKSAEIIKKYCS